MPAGVGMRVIHRQFQCGTAVRRKQLLLNNGLAIILANPLRRPVRSQDEQRNLLVERFSNRRRVIQCGRA